MAAGGPVDELIVDDHQTVVLCQVDVKFHALAAGFQSLPEGQYGIFGVLAAEAPVGTISALQGSAVNEKVNIMNICRYSIIQIKMYKEKQTKWK